MRTLYQAVRKHARQLLESTDFGFRFSLRFFEGGSELHGKPDAPWHNAVLKNQKEVDRVVKQTQALGLPLMKDLPKNWDSLAALDLILKSTDTNACIFDAGGEYYSMILPWLFLYGYHNLSAGNLVFEKPIRRGPIRYHYSDITQTAFDANSYDAITCLSVIEHGVNLRAYFKEMSRILKPGGLLITSADYYVSKIDTQDKMAYGLPIHIFSQKEIEDALEIAAEFNLSPIGELDFSVEDKVVNWQEFDLRFTFILFSLQKIVKI